MKSSEVTERTAGFMGSRMIRGFPRSPGSVASEAMLRCTSCRELVELIHGHLTCTSPCCPLRGLDQSEPPSGTLDEDGIALADVLRASSPGHLSAAIEEG